MSGSSNGMHIQVGLPTPTNHQAPWSPDGLYPFPGLDAQTKHAPLVQNRNLTWNHRGDFVAIAKPSLTDFEQAPVSQNFLPSQPNPTAVHPHKLDGLINTSDDSDAICERQHSPESSLTNNYSESELDESSDDDRRGDGAGGPMPSQTTGYEGSDGHVVPPSLTRPTMIRFRSRVRITSGLNRHRRSRNMPLADTESRSSTIRSTGSGGYYYLTPSSSISGSPSSSISAPLHSRTDDEADRPGWGPLGRRVSLFAKQNRMRKQGSTDDDVYARADDFHARQTRVTETSPLLIPPPRRKMHPHGQRKRRRCYCPDCGSSSRKLSPEEVDRIFGKWPNRMLNYQWWWWGAEGILCCRCLDETDDESY